MKLKNRSILLIASVLLLVASLTFVYAAFIISEKKENINFTVGNLNYELKGNLISDSLIVPGQNLINEEIKLINKSNIDTQFRFKISMDLTKSDLSVINLIQQNTYLEDFTFGSNLVLIDGYYYLESKDHIIKPSTILNEIKILNNIMLNGYLVKNDYIGAKIDIKINFEAKQAKNLTWEVFNEVIIG